MSNGCDTVCDKYLRVSGGASTMYTGTPRRLAYSQRGRYTYHKVRVLDHTLGVITLQSSPGCIYSIIHSCVFVRRRAIQMNGRGSEAHTHCVCVKRSKQAI